jgi:hypothetical protein
MLQRQRLLKGGLLGLALAAMVGVTVSAMPDPPPPPPVVGCAAIELPEPGNPNKVTLWPFTGSDGNPFVINEVSASAAESHSDHHGDCVNPSGANNTVCVP